MIVSASYRTDIPAFYGDWFQARLAEGYALVANPHFQEAPLTKLLAAAALAALLAFAAPAHAVAHSCGATLPTKQATVDSTCKPASKITCPNSGKTCAQLTTLFSAAKACKAARQVVNACFSPPDAGHVQAVAVVAVNVNTCQTQKQTVCAAEKKVVTDAACTGKAKTAACTFRFLDDATGAQKDFTGTCQDGKPKRVLTCKTA